MTNRVKNLEKITKEIATQISAWEEINGPFIYAVSKFSPIVIPILMCCAYPRVRDTSIVFQSKKKRTSKLETPYGIPERKRMEKMKLAHLLPQNRYQGNTSSIDEQSIYC